ncbi:uncharacterized protein LOC132950866 isoform X2 [Metopolophium dirhodum]|uniref:uncharacterized protein LOC132950866 isoform X2 n=1 Tax=Metopolophium dirhodum TaxID=44670 RepID=UPI00298F5510|nr:uncharacterized protein LOC132950866 isoform X2 [Metopolophium dirhodum]
MLSGAYAMNAEDIIIIYYVRYNLKRTLFKYYVLGFVTVEFLHVCFVFGRISNGAPEGFCHAPVGGWRHLSPDSPPARRKIPAEDRTSDGARSNRRLRP